MGPFATEEECRYLLSTLSQIPRLQCADLSVLKKYKRRQKRIRIKLPVQVSPPAHREDSWLAHTVDISILGARLIGKADRLHLGELVELSCGLRRAMFRVIWIGLASTPLQDQVGLECLNPESNIWDLDLSERTDDEHLLKEIAVARVVQTRLLPHEQPLLRTLDYCGNCIQARAIGGDYYDFLDLGEGQVGFVLADVSGKGIAAALLMANLQGSLNSYAGRVEGHTLPKLLSSLNKHLFKHTDSGRYASLFFGDYDDRTRTLHYVNCGHNPPLLLRHEGIVERLDSTATVLGLFREWDCTMGETQLDAGDVLAIFTDGIVETRGQGGEEYGEMRLLHALQRNRELDAASILRDVEHSAGKFRAGTPQEDDLTLVIAKGQ